MKIVNWNIFAEIATLGNFLVDVIFMVIVLPALDNFYMRPRTIDYSQGSI